MRQVVLHVVLLINSWGMGFSGCFTSNCKQRWFGSLASTCMTHLLLLLLLRDERRSQVGAMNSTCKDTWAGDVQQMVKQRSLQHDNTVASSAKEHAGGCCRGGQQHNLCNVGQERVGWGSKAWRGHTATPQHASSTRTQAGIVCIEGVVCMQQSTCYSTIGKKT